MSYFSYLPEIQYNITGSKYGETTKARDIFIRNLMKQNVIDKAINFDLHTIGDTERPDTTSYLVYGHVKYDWIIFLTNKMFNPYFNWPLSSQDFAKMIKGKYGSVIRAKKLIHEYRQIIEEETETTSLKEVIIDKDAYNALTDVDRKRITKYDIEFKKNEANRRIKIIDRQYVENIMKEAQTKRYR
ncbi:MAG: baseplate wedge protein 53 [Pseudomonadota bacterium]|nr:baseplate wedge protein 53 [Pseudomonadota bacterium]